MPGPRLRRFDLTIFKDKSTTDSTPVVFSGASIEFYRQGATVRTAVTIPPTPASADVEVFDVGSLRAGDAVMAMGVGTPLVVDSITPTKVRLRTTHGAPAVLQAGDRLLVVSERPQVYADPFGTVPLGKQSKSAARLTLSAAR